MRLALSCVMAATASVASLSLRATETSAPRVELMSLPAGGIQPQAIVDDRGALHVLYFKGPPSGGELYYMRREPEASAFSQPVRVNSVAQSALATGSVRGGQLAIDANGRAHVAWYGAKEIVVAGTKRRPVWYARLAAGSAGFAPQVNVAVASTGIDGATVAADGAGHVYVAWHGQGKLDGEAHRTVYVARSQDAGGHFTPEEAAPQASTGACACCGLRAVVDSAGVANILYRSAAGGVSRDTAWLTLSGTASKPVVLQTWELNVCPMSTFALVRDGTNLAAAWETAQQIYYSRLDPATRTFSAPLMMEGSAGRKHPSMAIARDGVTLVAWTEGTGWSRGGTVAWQMLDRQGKKLGAQSNAAPVPVWGLVAAVARPDGSFLVLY